MKLFENDLKKIGFKHPITEGGEPNKDYLEFFMQEMDIWLILHVKDFSEGVEIKDLFIQVDKLCKENIEDRLNESNLGLEL